MSLARARTQTIRSWGVRTNHFKAPYPALPRLTLPYRALPRLTTYKVVEQQTPQTPHSENYKKIIPSTKNHSFAIPKISSGTKKYRRSEKLNSRRNVVQCGNQFIVLCVKYIYKFEWAQSRFACNIKRSGYLVWHIHGENLQGINHRSQTMTFLIHCLENGLLVYKHVVMTSNSNMAAIVTL